MKVITRSDSTNYQSAHTREPTIRVGRQLSPDELVIVPSIAEMKANRESACVKKYALEGARFGFKLGSWLTICGIPLAISMTDAENKKMNRTNVIKRSNARKRRWVYRAIALPGMALSGLTAGFGAAIGAVVGKIKSK